MNNRLRVLLATAGVPAAAIAVSALLVSMWQPRLPDVVAVHWTNGTPNNSASLGLFVTIALLLGAGFALAGSVLAVTTLRRGNALTRTTIGFIAGFSVFPASCAIGILLANLDVRDWTEATGSALVAVVTLLAAVVGGALAALVGGTTPATWSPSGPGDDAPAIGLVPGERAVWVGSTTNRFLLAGVVVAPLVGLLVDQLAMVPMPLWIYGLLTGIGLVVTLIASRVSATVDANGVTIRMGLLGRPRRHLPLDEIDHAKAAELGRFEGGGFGYRVNPLTGTTLYKMRGGPALAITLRQGGLVYVTVDHPEPGAGLLNDLLRHRAATS